MYNTENQKTTGAFSGARSLIDPCIEARRSGDLMELPWEKRRKLVSNGGIRDDLSRLRRFVRGLRQEEEKSESLRAAGSTFRSLGPESCP